MSPPTGATVVWGPEELAVTAEQLATWSYVVLEEIVDQTALLRSWHWPAVDLNGRLVWPPSEERASLSATVSVELLRRQAYVPNGLQRRPRCGDTFAAARLGAGWRRRARVTDLQTLFDGPLYDISAAARDASKLAYQGGMAAVRPLSSAPADTRVLVRAAQQTRPQRTAPLLTIAPASDTRSAPSRQRPRR